MISLRFDKKELKNLSDGLSIVSKIRGFAFGESGEINVSVKRISSGLSIEGNDGTYTISWAEKNDFFRAVCMLVGYLESGQSYICKHEEAKMKMCGTMLDCSRNAVLKVETVIKLMGKMASAGMNTVMLYTEDTYEIEGYPYFGYMRGRYTVSEIREMDQAAQALGMEMIPCIQTLAHLRNTLRWSYAAEMKDDDDVLLIDEDKTYDFIEAMFKSAKASYSSNKILIGMDEAHFVGRGRYYDLHGDSDRFELLSKHLTRVCEIAKKYGFEPIMWSDMFFRLGSKNGWYYDLDAKIPEDMHERIPEEITLGYWDYYNTNKEMYRFMIDKHFEMRRKTIFVGGAWIWLGMGPGYQKTFNTTCTALAVCHEKGLDSIITTMWGDDGAEVNVLTMLGGIQLFAEYNYYETVDTQHLKEHFKLCMGYDLDNFLALEIDNIPAVAEKGNLCAVSREIVYQDVLCGIFDKNFEGLGLKEYYRKKYEELKNISEPGLEALFDYYRSLIKVLYEKAEIGIEIKDAYDRRDTDALGCLVSELKFLLADYRHMCEKFEVVWNAENKAFGFDVYDLRTGGAKARIETAIRKLTAYINGELEAIEELEVERLYYLAEDNKTPSIGEHFHKRIATVFLSE